MDPRDIPDQLTLVGMLKRVLQLCQRMSQREWDSLSSVAHLDRSPGGVKRLDIVWLDWQGDLSRRLEQPGEECRGHAGRSSSAPCYWITQAVIAVGLARLVCEVKTDGEVGMMERR